MGNSQVSCSELSMRSPELSFHDRAIKSIIKQPIDLECRVPDWFQKLKSCSSKFCIKRRFSRKVTRTSESIYRRDHIKSAEISDWPSRFHVLLTISYKGYSCISSGAIIGPRLVLTTASNVYSRQNVREIDKRAIEISARKATGNGVIKMKVIELYYPKRYTTTGEEDFALLVLDRDIGAFTGSFGIKPIEDEELEEKSLYLSGYEKQDERLHKYQIKREGPFQGKITRGLIEYDIETSKFECGSILYYQENSNYYAIGLVSQSMWYLPQAQKTLHLNSSRVSKLKSWIKEYYMKYNIFPSLDLSIFPHSIADLTSQLTSRADLDHLICLDLKGNNLGPKGAKLIASIKFHALRALNLERNALVCSGAKEISRGRLASLTHLKLGENEIGSMGAHFLANGKLTNLMALDLYNNRLGNEGAIYLARGHLNRLTYLNLGDNQLGPSAAKGLASGNLNSLTDLYLAHNRIGNDGAFELSQGNLIKLHSLDLSANLIGSEGAAALSHGKLVELTILHLDYNHIGEKAVARLARGNARNLNKVLMRGNTFKYCSDL